MKGVLIHAKKTRSCTSGLRKFGNIHQFCHLLSIKGFLLFVAREIHFETFRHIFRDSSADITDMTKKSFIPLFLLSAYMGHSNKTSYSILEMQTAQF